MTTIQNPVTVRDVLKMVPVFGTVPSSFDSKYTLEEQIMWLKKYLTDEVVPALNLNSQATADLIAYVENFFDNLDVQTEIDNKLDEMTEAGTLQEIIAEYLSSNVAWTFDTVADMKAATNLVNGSYARTLGFHTLNDGGGALYKITDSGTANEMDIIAVGDLYATLINPTNVKQYGAYGDNEHNDSSSIQRAITANYQGSIYIPKGEYLIYTPINITNSIKIYGNGNDSALIKKDTSAYNESINFDNVPFNFNNYPSIFNAVFSTDTNLTYLKINGLRFSENVEGATKATYAIVAPHLTYSSIENCRFNGFNNAIELGGWCDCIRKCEFFTSTLAINVDTAYTFINNTISECYFNTAYVWLRNAHNCVIENSQSDRNTRAFILNNCESVTLNGCSTECYGCCVRADNSYVVINSGDYELHNKDRYESFFIAQNAGKIIVNNANIHYEDYATPGVYPDNTNLVSNTGGSAIEVNNCKIETPFTYKDYLSGNGYTKINDYVNSNVLSVASVIKKTSTTGTKIELFRLPFAYGKRIQARVLGYGGGDYAGVALNTTISALNRGSSARIITVDDNTQVASNNNAYTATVTAEYDTDELVIYLNCSSSWEYPIECTVEYNKA